jgi:hypothetical protein
MSSIYFCVLCPQKFTTIDEKSLTKHLFETHFENSNNSEKLIIKEWIKSMIEYQKNLNKTLSFNTKQLPENNVSKLLIGCKVCDLIIDCFKLRLDFRNKSKDKCICGIGSNCQLIVVYCQQCKHLYHFDCVEPKPYSGLISFQLKKKKKFF